MTRTKRTLGRREALRRIGVLGIGAAVAACGGSDGNDAAPAATPSSTATLAPPTTASATATRSATPSSTPTTSPTPLASGTPAPACILTPDQTAGPFYLDAGLARGDIREGRSGAPLRLALQLVRAGTCAPICDAVVNVWHTDAAGRYSGFPNQPGGVDTTGQTFLRGFQVTDADGRVEFATIYPGWYPGRTVHIHVRVHLDVAAVLTTQLYFPESVTDAMHAQAPYSARGRRDTTNATDAIARGDLPDLLLAVEETAAGHTASIVLGIAAA